MLFGRADELAALDGLVADLLAGRGHAIVVHGEAGIGKTALLDAVAARCSATVVRTRGVESEAELSFAGLGDLLAPLAERRAALPGPQAAALGAALALGPPQIGDRLAVCMATVALLREAGPVLAIADDVHWIDAPSRECLLYAARRAGGPVAFVLAARDGEPALAELTDLTRLAVTPLQREDALSLLARTAPDLAAPVSATVADAASGNPLALVELPATLTLEQRAGRAAIDLPLAPGERLQSAFAERIGALPDGTRAALLVASLYAGADVTTLAGACRAAGTDVQRLAAAEARGLLRIAEGRLTFAHPLIRGAVRQVASPEERRAAHRALANVLHGERRAWHLAAATVGPDEEVAVALDLAAAEAAGRRGFASAAAAFERAARLSVDGEAFARRMLTAGKTAAAAGLPDRALTLFAEAAGATGDPRLRARAEHRQALAMLLTRSVDEAVALLIAGAERVIGDDTGHAAVMLADAALILGYQGQCVRGLLIAEQAARLLGDGGNPRQRTSVLAALGWTLVLRGHGARAVPVLAAAERAGADLSPLSTAGQSLQVAVNVRLASGEYERALADSRAIGDLAREAGAVAGLVHPLIVQADATYRIGDWDAADAAADEAVELAATTAQDIWHGYALAIRARLAAARGRADAARRDAEQVLAIAEDTGMRSGFRFAHGALGFLELGLDRVEEAIARLERVERLVTDSGVDEPTMLPWAPDLVEAYARAGRIDGAERVIETLARQAASAGGACAGAMLGRSCGTIAEDFDQLFADALALDERRPMPFERARTQLAYGRRLHRVRRRAEARDCLRAALAGFERLGADPWTAQAQRELRAAGARRRPARSDTLTPQEQRVAAAVARGASNREIAAELFLAPKTIEFHLHQIYRKLGARSRPELVAKLAQEPATMVGAGFEPAKAEPMGLQPIPFDRSGTPPGERGV